ncbi:hypothetical protein D3C73_883900 [compost metagenome]
MLADRINEAGTAHGARCLGVWQHDVRADFQLIETAGQGIGARCQRGILRIDAAPLTFHPVGHLRCRLVCTAHGGTRLDADQNMFVFQSFEEAQPVGHLFLAHRHLGFVRIDEVYIVFLHGPGQRDQEAALRGRIERVIIVA